MTSVPYTFLIVFLIAAVIDLVSGTGDATALTIFAVALVIEKFMTVYHSNGFIEEYLPKQKPA